MKLSQLGALLILGTFGLGACGAIDKAKDVKDEVGDVKEFADDLEENSELATELAELLEKQSESEFKVEYERSGDGLSEGDPTELAWAQDPDQEKFSMVFPESAYYQTDGDLITCSDLSAAEPACTSTPGADAEGFISTAGLGFFSTGYLTLFAGSLFGGEEDDGRTIAGRAARCFSWDANDIPGVSDEELTSEVCIDKKTGVLLFDETVSEGETITIEATDYSSNTSDTDFEPPAEVLSLEDLAGE